MKQRKLPFALSEFERDVVLIDGSTVHLRPIHQSDADGIRLFFQGLSARSRYLRFHHPRPRVSDEDIRRFTKVDYRKSFGIVATLGAGADERIIGVGHYMGIDNNRADAALAVEDSHQGLGIGTQIVETLAQAARRNGISAFEADVLAENNRMINVFRDIGYPVHAGLKYGTLHVEFPTAETKEELSRSEERDAIAAAASLRVFFEPRTVAVVGASREAGTVGFEIFHNALRGGFKGTVYPVNKKASAIAGVRAYASVLDIPDDIDLAIIAVPAAVVIDVADECAQKGARGIVVISAGFREAEGGAERELALLHKMRAYGIRMVGPNCMGVLNADPAVSFNGTFSPVLPPSGNIGLLTQSGALGLALLDYARDLNIGLSTFISVGNKADVSGNDLIQYWERDASTDVILLYLESFGNPRKFARLARRVSAKKPIVAVKSGRTVAGSRAALSHTGALASVDVAVDALFRQSGVIRVETLEDLFDVAALLAHQPLPHGQRVAILTNAGGPGILAADACEATGLNVVELSAQTQAALRRHLPSAAGVHNPVDMIATASPEAYRSCLEVLLADEGIDALIVIFIPPLATSTEEVASAIRNAAKESDGRKTILTCFMSAHGAPRELTYGSGSTLPSYVFPESAARALAKVADYAAWRKRPRGVVAAFKTNQAMARRVISAALKRSQDGEAWLSPSEWQKVLDAYGIHSAPLASAHSPSAAALAARRLGFPVAVKLVSPTITHKSDIGGVVLGASSGRSVQRAYRRIREQVEALGRLAEMEGVVVQKMIPGGVEALVGVTQDPSFGPLIMFGLGGTMVELMKDVQVLVQPITDVDARDLVRSIKGYPLLEGWRGAPPADVAGAEELLLRVSQMVEELPEIVEMDLNPVKLLTPGEGAVAVDCRILVKASS